MVNKKEKQGIVSVKVRVKDKVIDLTLDEAKELKEELDKLFAEPAPPVWIPYPGITPYIWPQPYSPISPTWITIDRTITVSENNTSNNLLFS